MQPIVLDIRSMMKTKIFEHLVSVLQTSGDIIESTTSDGVFRLYLLSELTLVVKQTNDNTWEPDGITFELFGNEFFLMPDGSISVADEEMGQDSVYALTDGNLDKAVFDFLQWRVSVLENLHI
jgi:hypothetical protein